MLYFTCDRSLRLRETVSYHNVPRYAVKALEFNHATTFIRSTPLNNRRQITLAPRPNTAEQRRHEIAFRSDPDGARPI